MVSQSEKEFDSSWEAEVEVLTAPRTRTDTGACVLGLFLQSQRTSLSIMNDAFSHFVGWHDEW